MSEGLKLVGRGRAIIRDPQGNVVSDSGWMYNQIKTAGKTAVAKLIGTGLGGTVFNTLAIGTSNTANTVAQTALVAEISTNGGARGAATVTNETTTTAGDTIRFVKTWTAATGGFTVEEVGILNNATSGGDLLGRLLTGTQAITTNGSTFTFTYDIILS